MAGYEGGMNAVKCALTTISPERMVFGTDYPYNFRDDPQGVKQYIENIRKLALPPKSIDGMLGLNAAELLGLP
jgi:predicted TIM-barrel fold metal-dependent hydrolase